LIQRAMEHYRAGRLEESWKTLQIYVLQDPDNESARQLLEKITFEMRIRQTMEKKQIEIDLLLQSAERQKAFNHYEQAIASYEQVLKIDPTNLKARQNFDELKNLTASKQTVEKIQMILDEADKLWKQRRLDDAFEKANQVLYLDPQNAAARDLRVRIEAERLQMNRISVQLELATYLGDRGQKDAAAMILNRILNSDPSQQQAKQLLAKTRGTPPAPKAFVEIRIQPSARLFIDGRDMGIGDSFNQMEFIGNHILHVERLGYHSIDQAVEVQGAQKNVFTFQLKEY